MAIIIRNAEISGGDIFVDPERERFENCYFRDVGIVAGPGGPVFVSCFFEDCKHDLGVGSFNFCIFYSNPFLKGEWLAQRCSPGQYRTNA